MKASEVLLGLNDIYGRLIPGLLLLGDLYIMEFVCEWDLLRGFQFNALDGGIGVVLTLVAAGLLGEIPLRVAFRVRKWFLKRSVESLLVKVDVVVDEKIKKFFHKRFAKEALRDSQRLISVMDFCKAYLRDRSPAAYTAAKKKEARTNLLGGMVIPLVLLSVLLGKCLPGWELSLVCAIAATGFFYVFVREVEVEAKLVLRAFYIANT